MLKKIIDGFIDHPVLASLFVVDLAILLLHKPPFIFALIMQGGLVAISMYLGQKLAPFKD